MNERQTQIVQAAMLLFVTEGVGVSTARVAKAADVSNGTLFNAFSTKQDLIDAMYLHAMQGVFDALGASRETTFSRGSMHEKWSSYLDWARREPFARQIKHLLLEAGLVSDAAKAATDKTAKAHTDWVADALAQGKINGPSVAFIVQLIFFHIDLVISHELNGADEALAFDMLCQSIGLSP